MMRCAVLLAILCCVAARSLNVTGTNANLQRSGFDYFVFVRYANYQIRVVSRNVAKMLAAC
jgi:hypothetical protein